MSGLSAKSRTNQAAVRAQRQPSGTRATALVGHATDNPVASGLCFDESSAEKETSPKQSDSSTRLRSSPGRKSKVMKEWVYPAKGLSRATAA